MASPKITSPSPDSKTATPPGAPKTPPAAGSRPTLPAAPGRSAPVRVAKTFRVEPWVAKGEGEKIILVGTSGVGKTSLAAMAPEPVFIGLDDGARKIGDPRTGKPVLHIPGVESFDDLRDAIRTPSIFTGRKSVVIDTITKAEELAEPWVLANYKTEKGNVPKSLEHYGWGKGYKHLQEAMRLLQQDFDILIRQGINVILLAQESAITVPNVEGADFLQAGPKLTHTKQFSVRLDYQEWADHVVRIGYMDTTVVATDGAKAGKLVNTEGATQRAIFTAEARHFFAKNRGVLNRETGIREALPPVISFENPADDSFWQILFPQA